MPLPIALAALAAGSALAGAIGLKKGHDAHKDNKKAGHTRDKAQTKFKSAKSRLKKSRKKGRNALDTLGKLKVDMWADDLGRFVDLFGQLKNVEISGTTGLGEFAEFVGPKNKLDDMRAVSFKAQELLTGGAASLGSGALAGVAAYGGAMTFGAASTGTAIGSLSGVAATNATLAWFGGGSLAAGGMGMAGGAVVLGGIVAGPVLAVGGVVLAAKAKTNLANAKKDLTKAKVAAAQMNTASALVDGIRKVLRKVSVVLGKLRNSFAEDLDNLEELLREHGVNWNQYTPEQRTLVHRTVLSAQLAKGLLEAPILTPDGALANAYVDPLRKARKSLE